jgi:hypothetical protein
MFHPSFFGLQHEDVELLTADRIILRCYLLRPTKTSSRTKASGASEPVELEAAVVCRNIQSFFLIMTLHANGWFESRLWGP